MYKLHMMFLILISVKIYAVDINTIDINDKYYYPTNANAFNTFYSLVQPDQIKPSLESFFKYKVALKALIGSIDELTVLRIVDKNTQTIKFRYDDGTPAYINAGFLLTKNDIDILKFKLYQIERQECCCHPNKVKDILFSGEMMKNTMAIAEQVTIEECSKGWKTKTTFFGNPIDHVYSSGECVDTTICEEYAEEKEKERMREKAW